MNQLELYLDGVLCYIPEDISAKMARHTTKKHDLRELSNIKRIVLHTTDWNTTPRRISEYDVAKNHISNTGCPGITYHEIIMTDTTCYKTLPYEEVSWHAGPWNTGSLAVALMYRVSNTAGVDSYEPTEECLKAAVVRCGELCLSLGITPDNVVGHRELQFTGWTWAKGSKVRRKTCPGMKIDLDLFRTRVAGYMQLWMKTKGCYNDDIDGSFGPVSKAALKKLHEV